MVKAYQIGITFLIFILDKTYKHKVSSHETIQEMTRKKMKIMNRKIIEFLTQVGEEKTPRCRIITCGIIPV